MELLDNEKIKKVFHSFFSNLYKKQEISLEKINDYLNRQDLPKLTQSQKAILNDAITTFEIVEAIKKTKLGKAPGPDCLSAIYYRCFEDQILLPFKTLMNSILTGSLIPDSWKEANIALVPKEGQDPCLVKNYRPISLLNNDNKIFASVLAERMKKVLQEIIHHDQCGVLPKRQLKDNVRVVLDVTEYLQYHNECQAALIFLDVEKAFDNLNWTFMFKVLEIMDF